MSHIVQGFISACQRDYHALKVKEKYRESCWSIKDVIKCEIPTKHLTKPISSILSLSAAMVINSSIRSFLKLLLYQLFIRNRIHSKQTDK